MTEPEIVEETWIFGGSRVGKGGVKAHAWIPATSTPGPEAELWFKANGSYAVGAAYTVRVSRTETTTTKHGAPEFLRRIDGVAGWLIDWTPERLAALSAAHSAAETRLRLAAMERNAKRSSELDAALEPLLTIAGRMTAPDRAAFIAYVTTRLAGAWRPGRG